MKKTVLDRRDFAGLLAIALVPGTTSAGDALAQVPGAAPAKKALPLIQSGVYPPGPETKSGGRTAHKFLAGMLTAGNIQIEMHETRQEPGTPHEAVGHHLHNEIWLVREGVCELTTNGVTRRMKAGEVGICCAGDEHYIANAGDVACQYFVVTVGPPE